MVVFDGDLLWDYLDIFHFMVVFDGDLLRDYLDIFHFMVVFDGDCWQITKMFSGKLRCLLLTGIWVRICRLWILKNKFFYVVFQVHYRGN